MAFYNLSTTFQHTTVYFLLLVHKKMCHIPTCVPLALTTLVCVCHIPTCVPLALTTLVCVCHIPICVLLAAGIRGPGDRLRVPADGWQAGHVDLPGAARGGREHTEPHTYQHHLL